MTDEQIQATLRALLPGDADHELCTLLRNLDTVLREKEQEQPELYFSANFETARHYLANVRKYISV